MRSRGQVIRRGVGTWLIRVPNGRDAVGKRIYVNETVHGPRREAERRRTEILFQLDAKTFVEADAVTVNEFLEQWIEGAQLRVRHRTADGYRQLLALYILPKLGRRRVQDLRPADLQGLVADLHRRGLSARTIRAAFTVLRSALNQALRWKIVSHNAADAIDLPKLRRRETRTLTADEIARFRAAASTSPHAVLFDLLIASGMRPGEALALRWSNFNPVTGVVSVRSSLAWLRGGKGYEINEPKTARSRRNISLPAEMTRELVTHRRRQAEVRLASSAAYRADLDLVFASQYGTPLNERNLVQRHFKRILKMADLPSEIRLYDLRHSHATLLLEGGMNAKVISDRLGHASVSFTLDTYVHSSEPMQQRAAEMVGDLLFASTMPESGTTSAKPRDRK